MTPGQSVPARQAGCYRPAPARNHLAYEVPRFELVPGRQQNARELIHKGRRVNLDALPPRGRMRRVTVVWRYEGSKRWALHLPLIDKQAKESSSPAVAAAAWFLASKYGKV